MPRNVKELLSLPYDPEEFAEKHGLSVKQATVVLMGNRRSKEQADIGAAIFKRLVAARSKG